ncbi:MAG: bifunctional alpha/beta hydrolase/OsmC family protein [Pseudomonadota bacterium]
MQRQKIEFANSQGEQLAGLLESPDQPRAYALFAHCFTCGKDLTAASRITRTLAEAGIATLRFDFTGLGGSDGDFANTNFSGNVQDLLAAAKFLAAEYQAPKLLIGHSLGGAAVLAAAHALPKVRAVATIGAPATAEHVKHLMSEKEQEIREADAVEVELAGRKFTIQRQFLEDLDRHNDTSHIAKLKKALLVLHSPLDGIVPIDEASRIYTAARHSKSFVSLDRADHLLSRREDAKYAAEVIAAWAGRYLAQPVTDAEPAAVAPGHVRITEANKAFTRVVETPAHRLLADEPEQVGGHNRGPNPYEYLLAALGTCTSMTMRMYANHKKLKLDSIDVDLVHDRVHAEDCQACESSDGYVDRIRKVVHIEGDLTEAQRARLLEIADRCPVHKTLHNEILIETEYGAN